MPTLQEQRQEMDTEFRAFRERIESEFPPELAGSLINAMANVRIFSPKEVKPIIASSSQMFLGNLQNLPVEFQDKPIKSESYLSAEKELVALRSFLEKHVLHDALTGTTKKLSKAKLREAIVKRIHEKVSNVPEYKIKSLITHGDLVEDICSFYRDILDVTGGKQATTVEEWKAALFGAKRLITSKADSESYFQVSRKASRILFTSRLLGLIPRRVLERLRTLPIKVLGASAAMPMVRLLMLLGAEDITIVDDGVVDATKKTMMQAGGKMDGQFKVVALLRQLSEYNPDGNFNGIIGRTFEAEADKREGHTDLTFAELLDRAGIDNPAAIYEIVDDPQTKAKLRVWLKKNAAKYAKLILGWLADTHKPFAGLEVIDDEQFFNEYFTEADMGRFANISNLDEMLSMFWRILQRSLPAEHGRMFIMMGIEEIPFLSQTPLAAQESSVIAVSELLTKLTEEEYGLDSNIEGVNLTKAETNFLPDFDSDHLMTLYSIAKQMFAA